MCTDMVKENLKTWAYSVKFRTVETVRESRFKKKTSKENKRQTAMFLQKKKKERKTKITNILKQTIRAEAGS